MPATDDALRLEKAFGQTQEVAIVGVAMDAQDGSHSVLGAWGRGLGVDYELVTADATVRSGRSSLGRANAVPFTIVFDKSGNRIDRIDAPLGARGIERLRGQIL